MARVPVPGHGLPGHAMEMLPVGSPIFDARIFQISLRAHVLKNGLVKTLLMSGLTRVAAIGARGVSRLARLVEGGCWAIWPVPAVNNTFQQAVEHPGHSEGQGEHSVQADISHRRYQLYVPFQA